MKKTTLIFSAILVALATACTGRQSDSDEFRALNDSIANVLQFASMRNDTAKLEEALEMTDELQKLAESPEQKTLYYINRCSILYSLGRIEEARECKEQYIQCLPEDNPERLRHEEAKKLWNRYLTLKDKYEGDGRKDRIAAILENSALINLSAEIAEEYSCCAVLILEDCKSVESVRTFIKNAMEILAIFVIPISDPKAEKELEELSKKIYDAALK